MDNITPFFLKQSPWQQRGIYNKLIKAHSPERLKKARPSRQKEMEISLVIKKDFHMPHFLQMPENPRRRKNEKWRMILFLHGEGEQAMT